MRKSGGLDMTLLRAIAIALGLFAAGAPALGQTVSSPFNVAVLDTKLLMDKAAAAKYAREQIDKARAETTRLVSAHQEEMNQLHKAIAGTRSTMSEADFQEQMKVVIQKNATHMNAMQQRQASIDAASREAAQKIEVVVAEIVNEIRKERQYGMVVIRTSIMGDTTAPDITGEVIARLDKRLQRVEVSPKQ